MKRREFITLAGAAVAWPLAARAQQTKIRRLGVLSEGSISNHPTPSFRAFLEALREAGWIEGQNLTIEWRFSEGGSESLSRLVNELIGLQVELIVASPTRPTLFANKQPRQSRSFLLRWPIPLEPGLSPISPARKRTLPA
jgi:putative tryptophan/tyrosine transport system substrate-binding protein